MEMNKSNSACDEARVAPAVGVAHLGRSAILLRQSGRSGAIGEVHMCDRFLMADGAAVGAWKQTSAEPLDCFVRAFGAAEDVPCCWRRSGRAAARS
jgi:hypothetical protein